MGAVVDEVHQLCSGEFFELLVKEYFHQTFFD